MLLRQTLAYPIDGAMRDGGKKHVFDWSIDGHPKTDSKGQYVRIGSFAANHWFHVALGKTTKATLANAKKHLRAITRAPCIFEYIREDSDNPKLLAARALQGIWQDLPQI